MDRAIRKIVDHYVSTWIRHAAQDHDLSEDMLLTSWETYCENHEYIFSNPLLGEHVKDDDMMMTTSSQQPSSNRKPVPAYVRFCNVQRQTLKSSYPNMTFGEISKELGRMWRQLPHDQKKVYYEEDEVVVMAEDEPTTNAGVPCTKHPSSSPSSSPSPPPIGITGTSSLQKQTLVQLRDMCTERGLKKTGNKEILIQRLLHHEQSILKKPSVIPSSSSSSSSSGLLPSHTHTLNMPPSSCSAKGMLTFEDEDTDSMIRGHHRPLGNREDGDQEDDDDDDLSNTSSASFQFDDDDDGDISIDGIGI